MAHGQCYTFFTPRMKADAKESKKNVLHPVNLA
jgi:hypothetical protein